MQSTDRPNNHPKSVERSYAVPSRSRSVRRRACSNWRDKIVVPPLDIQAVEQAERRARYDAPRRHVRKPGPCSFAGQLEQDGGRSLCEMTGRRFRLGLVSKEPRSTTAKRKNRKCVSKCALLLFRAALSESQLVGGPPTPEILVGRLSLSHPLPLRIFLTAHGATRGGQNNLARRCAARCSHSG